MTRVSQPQAVPVFLDDYETRGSNQTILLNTLSTFFPEGEQFFIDAVRHYRGKAPQEQQTDISRFIGQEAYHSKAHVAINEKLYKDGYKDVSMIVQFFLSKLMKYCPKLSLHVTAHLEHYTATLARQVLDGEYQLELGQAVPWYTHAFEEWEHRFVSWDLLNSVGSKFLNKLLFPVTSVVFITTIAIMYVLNGGRWDTQLFKKLFKNVPELLRYMKPGFRP